MTPASAGWRKPYRDSSSCAAAAAHHAWLAGLGAPVPALRTVRSTELEFQHVNGTHARPGDLPALAELLGGLHRTAYLAELHHAHLGRTYRTTTGKVLADFPSRRAAAVTRLLADRTIPAPRPTPAQALDTLYGALAEPACFYKDSNPRNFLITPGGPVLVDFDTLTLAPPGYDLAKLVVTLAMTHGPLPTAPIRHALALYNAALTRPPHSRLRPVPWPMLMSWTALHHILTSPYLGQGGYQHSWTGEPG